MRYAFDIDNTLVSTKDNDYVNSTPIANRIKYVNKLYDEDHYIILYTARGSRSGKDYRDLTESQMKKFGVKYHELVMGKVDCDFFIDDKAVTLKEFDAMMVSKSSNSSYKSGEDSGYNFDDYGRFNSLVGLQFASVLDIGSGPCMLHKWFTNNGYEVSYEAMDIRSEALECCNCKTHIEIPKRKKYDLVCLFGVSDYCNDDEDNKKKEFYNLLKLSIKRSKDIIIFSLIKDSIKSNRLVKYSLAEIDEIVKDNNLVLIGIDEASEPTEYIVKCKIK